MDDLVLEIQGLRKSYKKQCVLQHVNLQVQHSSICALLGPNGSGKTTLLKIILGLIYPTSYILFKNIDKEDIRYMPQHPNFPPNIKVSELLSLIQSLKKQKGEDLEELIYTFSVESFLDKCIRELSGGMKQRVNIVQAFMFPGYLYLLDEPTMGLDPHVAFLFKNLLRRKRDQGAAILFTSHIMSEVEQLADELVLMIEGYVYMQSDPQTIITEGDAMNLEQALHHYWIAKVD
ncbi:MAG: ABC transporter ATP-binding protein [Deltaproteobacteria bacterium]|nr:MAG: ABC transporter ATP-binding protein [Deltaproteobacteria bacterium]